MPILVMKFGGTSVADPERILNAAHKVKREVDAGWRVAVVVSAMSGETNRLVDLVRGISPLYDAREYDAVVASGEQVTSGLMALTLQSLGVPARSWQGWQIAMKTDATHGAARIDSIDTDQTSTPMSMESTQPTLVLYLKHRRLRKSPSKKCLNSRRKARKFCKPALSSSRCATTCPKITLQDVDDSPGIAAAIFGPLADAAVNVDMIVQNISEDNRTDMTFTVHMDQFDRAVATIEAAKDKIGFKGLVADKDVAKVSVVGIGMRSHTGVAQRMFAALADDGVNIQVITTSEIKVSVLIQRRYMELAVRSLHTAFGLESVSS